MRWTARLATLRAQAATTGASLQSQGTAPDSANSEPVPFVPSDPRFASQHHFGLIGDIRRIWSEYDGAGVKVGLYDSGVQWTHPDLQPNYDPSLHVVFNGVAQDGLPAAVDPWGHGTLVAGLLVGNAGGQNGVGVAFGASLTSVDVLDTSSPLYIYGSSPHGFDAALAQIPRFDIVSNSWGDDGRFKSLNNGNIAGSLGDRILDAWALGAATGRGGLGTVVLKSAGNKNVDIAGEGRMSSPFAVIVSATEPDGSVASFANFGANLLVSAPGRNLTSTDLLGSAGYGPGDYAQISGTSTATPIVAGVVALMLDANPNLGWRDVQEILAYSARHTGSAMGAPAAGAEQNEWFWNGADNWNGGGLHFSEDYGYGMVDAFAAVRMAEVWTELRVAATSANQRTVTTAKHTVAQNFGATWDKSFTFTVAEGIDIEHVTLTLELSASQFRQLDIWLVSPDGTEVRLASTLGLAEWAVDGTGLRQWTFGAQAFRGESSSGVWTVRIQDKDGASGSATYALNWLQLEFKGAPAVDDVYVYTSEYATLGTGARASLLDADSGFDIINAAAVAGASRYDLSGATASSVGGRALDIRPGIEAVFAGDGDDVLIGGGGAETLHGGRGADRLDGGGGADTLNGGAGSDVLVGGAGDDLLEGGSGDDRAVFAGLRADYTVTELGNGAVRIAGPDGADTVTGVEIFVFGEREYTLAQLMNRAPTVASPLADAAVAEGQPFELEITGSAFADPDGDALTLTATRADGTALPAWLRFDAATRTFSGVPTYTDAGVVDVRVTATDPLGATVSDVFQLTVSNTNQAPRLAEPLPDLAVAEDAAFSHQVPASAFSEPDGEALTYSVALADGSALPAWLSFDAATRTFSGMPLNGDVGTLEIRVTAGDPSGATASDIFRLTVANTNDAPTVVQPIADQAARELGVLRWTMDENVFVDVDAGDRLTFAASRPDGSALPAWLVFDALTRTFEAAPGAGAAGLIEVRVTATDSSGASVWDVFTLTVEQAVFTGTDAADTLAGTGGADVLLGLGGDDLLHGGRGDDLLVGGAGVDTAVFGATFAEAAVTVRADGWLVAGPDGRDTLTGVERLRFADGVVELRDGRATMDDLFYFSARRDVWNAGADPEAHYDAYGWREGTDPNGWFSTRGYLAANPDVRAAGVNPLAHYETHGWREGRDPSAAFDTDLYLLHNPDVAAAGVDPLAHYLEFGRHEGRAAYAAVGRAVAEDGFDAAYYYLANPDVAAAGMDARAHYEQYGWREGRDPNSWFDTRGYLAAYADVAAAGVNPFAHYAQFGWREGRDPSAGFDTTDYLKANTDVAAAGINPLAHFLRHGVYEWRASRGDGDFDPPGGDAPATAWEGATTGPAFLRAEQPHFTDAFLIGPEWGPRAPPGDLDWLL